MSRFKKFLKYLLAFFIGIIFLSLFFFFYTLNSWYNLGKYTLSAKNNIELSLDLILNEDFEKSLEYSQLAKNDFNLANKYLNDIEDRNPLFKFNINKVYLSEIDKLVSTGHVLSDSLYIISNLAIEANNQVNLFKKDETLTLDEKIILYDFFKDIRPEIITIENNIELSLYNLSDIEDFFILASLKDQLFEIRDRLKQANILLKQSLSIIDLFPALAGYPEKNRILLLFQNNDELRPTGGFIGSLATLEIENFGENIDMQVKDVYHLDMPSIEFLDTVPPEPISKYMGVEKWYLRDANWSPDFEISAKFIEELFYKEAYYANMEFNNLDAIIAITPAFIQNLLKLTGPIILDEIEYNEKNLQAELQYQTGIAYRDDDISSWDRKNIMNDLALILKDRLQNISNYQLLTLSEIIENAILRKDLQTYFTNNELQKKANRLNSSGQIIQTDNDYLMIVDANLAAFKTDAVVVKDWAYNLDIVNEKVIANLILDYKHEGDFNWRTTRYRSYTRVLTPPDSEFINLTGLNKNQADFSAYYDNELNKNVFAFFFSVEPNQNISIELSYALPDYIYQEILNGKYELYLQRQAGSRINSFNFNFSNLPKIDYFMPNIFNYSSSNNTLSLTKDLESDKLFRIYFK